MYKMVCLRGSDLNIFKPWNSLNKLPYHESKSILVDIIENYRNLPCFERDECYHLFFEHILHDKFKEYAGRLYMDDIVDSIDSGCLFFHSLAFCF